MAEDEELRSQFESILESGLEDVRQSPHERMAEPRYTGASPSADAAKMERPTPLDKPVKSSKALTTVLPIAILVATIAVLFFVSRGGLPKKASSPASDPSSTTNDENDDPLFQPFD